MGESIVDGCPRLKLPRRKMNPLKFNFQNLKTKTVQHNLREFKIISIALRKIESSKHNLDKSRFISISIICLLLPLLENLHHHHHFHCHHNLHCHHFIIITVMISKILLWWLSQSNADEGEEGCGELSGEGTP